MHFCAMRTRHDCGLAVAAMLAGRSYGAVWRRRPYTATGWSTGLGADGLVRLLRRLTGRWWHIYPGDWRMPLSELAVLDRPAAVSIANPDQLPGIWLSHWLAMTGPPAVVCDPLFEAPWELRDYPFAQLVVGAVVCEAVRPQAPRDAVPGSRTALEA
jgi:hypothetical protein